ncbi:MAG: 16S rRNA (cytidine(1402)-2'-O)-methyltransferase [Pseudomonadota bacterium]
MSNTEGCLFVVATPIGNLSDLSPRAAETLAKADLVLAEDTRHTARLLSAAGAKAKMLSLHEHNEHERIDGVLGRLADGQQIALVSDAGTPLVSDPGFRLVRAVRDAGYLLSPVPGPCAAIAGLSAAGLPSDRFVFEGFLPPKEAARQARLEALASERRTLVFYESVHRIDAALAALVRVFGDGRAATLARELTKTWETLYHGTLGDLAATVASDPDTRRGELVLVVAGAADDGGSRDDEVERWLRALVRELPVRQAAALAASATGRRRNEIYQLALKLKDEAD